MIPDRDYFLAKAEVRARRQAADAERIVREARREAAEQALPSETPEDRPRGAFDWLRRMAGAR